MYESKQVPQCPVHDIIKNQIFNLDEMNFLLRKRGLYGLCDSCAATFRHRIRDFNRSITRNISLDNIDDK
jgi:hypothetical protein